MKIFLNVLLLVSLSVVLCCGAKNDKESPNVVDNTDVVDESLKASVISTPIEISEEEFKTKVMNYEKYSGTWEYQGELPCIVDFYAHWCGPCRMVAPVLTELAKEYAGKIVVYKVNVDKARNLSSFFGIQSIPAFLISPKKGNPYMQAGAMNKATFVQIIEEKLLK